jgi:hypothetical protein
MPNPEIKPTTATAPADAGNGILARIGGEHIARAENLLPEAGPEAIPQTPSVEIDVPDLGKVTIRFRLKSSKHGRSRNWFWSPVFAEKA